MDIYKNITPTNRWEGRRGDPVEWIVMHYTGNPGLFGGDTAKGEAEYFAREYRGASAHFFVDPHEVWQSVELSDTAWHCGDGASRNGCRNTNSIGIEMCDVYADGIYSIPAATADRAAELVRFLLTLYPGARICRHFDVTGKTCPEPWVRDPALYEEFLEKVRRNGMTDSEKKELRALERRLKSLEQKIKAGEDFDRIVSRELKELDRRTAVRWDDVKDCPAWLAPTVEKLVENGSLRGEGGGLGLTYDLARALVICDRAERC